jgi:hypothetical protein
MGGVSILTCGNEGLFFDASNMEGVGKEGFVGLHVVAVGKATSEGCRRG